MDGSWRVTRGGRPARADHTVRIILETGDVRAAGVDLGVLEVLDRAHDQDAVAHLGPDLLGDDWDPHRAAANLAAGPARSLAALLDQRVLAGWATCTATSCVSSSADCPPARSAPCPTHCA